MAIEMKGSYELPLPREAVWNALNDPDVLKASIPGCESLDAVDGGGFRAVASVKIGPVKARFKGAVRLEDLDPPMSYRIVGEGEGGIAGFAKGGALVKLADIAGGTELSYEVEVQVGGKLAQLGQRLIAGSAKKLADQFFVEFCSHLTKTSS